MSSDRPGINEQAEERAEEEAAERALCEKLHEEACARGEALYVDPTSGLMTCTRVYLLQQGRCCQSGCRHCPYGFRKPE